MANNYYDMTGVLVLDKVTPVIKALFGALELDESYPGNGEAYIACISESSSSSWDDVLDHLRELVEDLKLSLPEDAEDNMDEHLFLLANYFKADDNYELSNLIEQRSFEDDADLESLFTIAKAFDDGHGLKSIRTETSWHCSKPRLFEFGGCGNFIGTHVSVSGSSDQITAMGEHLEDALGAKDISKAADVLFKNVSKLLSGIDDADLRKSVQYKLSDLLGDNISF